MVIGICPGLIVTVSPLRRNANANGERLRRNPEPSPCQFLIHPTGKSPRGPEGLAHPCSPSRISATEDIAVQKETDDVYTREEHIHSDVRARAKKGFRGIVGMWYGIRLTLRASERIFSMNESMRNYCYWHMQDVLSSIRTAFWRLWNGFRCRKRYLVLSIIFYLFFYIFLFLLHPFRIKFRTQPRSKYSST